MKLTQRQERFCLLYFETGNATQSAVDAGYSTNTARVIAYENLQKPDIKARLVELGQKLLNAQDKAETNTIMTVQERKERLSEIAAENVYSAKGTLMRTGNTQAIDLLNKMEHIYSDGAVVNIDNRKVEIIVGTEGAKILTERLLHGELPSEYSEPAPGEAQDNQSI